MYDLSDFRWLHIYTLFQRWLQAQLWEAATVFEGYYRSLLSMRLTNNKFNGDIARSRFWNIPRTSANFLTFLPELNSTDDLLK